MLLMLILITVCIEADIDVVIADAIEDMLDICWY